jgi:selenocysteine lyase/cysteine desulfurase
MDAASLRAEFPVLERIAYLNAGTCGPVPRRGAAAAVAQIEREASAGRSGPVHFPAIGDLAAGVRRRLAGLLGCPVDEVALTHSATDSMNTVVWALDLGPGDEVVTSDEEHPGLLAPLAAARAGRGFDVRVVPFDEVAGEVRPRTKLVACSHVCWVRGKLADTAALAACDAMVLLDGAQGLGAIPVDVRELGCDFYAAAGQKWLCGPEGSGSLYVRRELADSLTPPWPSFTSLADPLRALGLVVHPGAPRFDMGHTGCPLAWSLAAHDVLAGAGWDAVHQRGPALAGRLADSLAERGAEVAERDRTTLVSWRSSDPEGEVERLAAAGVVVRQLPGRGLVRASVGAWSSEDDLERLLAVSPSGSSR